MLFFSPGTPVFSINLDDCLDVIKLFLEVALNTNNPKLLLFIEVINNKYNYSVFQLIDVLDGCKWKGKKTV